jgi:hypothetical protein
MAKLFPNHQQQEPIATLSCSNFKTDEAQQELCHIGWHQGLQTFEKKLNSLMARATTSAWDFTSNLESEVSYY